MQGACITDRPGLRVGERQGCAATDARSKRVTHPCVGPVAVGNDAQQLVECRVGGRAVRQHLRGEGDGSSLYTLAAGCRKHVSKRERHAGVNLPQPRRKGGLRKDERCAREQFAQTLS